MKTLFSLLFVVLSLVSLGASEKERFFITPTGKHYHLFADCQSLKHSSKVKEVSSKEVKNLPLCGFCKHRTERNNK